MIDRTRSRPAIRFLPVRRSTFKGTGIHNGTIDACEVYEGAVFLFVGRPSRLRCSPRCLVFRGVEHDTTIVMQELPSTLDPQRNRWTTTGGKS